MTVLDVLTDESRWVKREFGIPGQPRCLVGALDECYLTPQQFDAALILLEETIRTLFPERCAPRSPTVPIFNDHPDTTFEDVRRVVKVAGV